MSDKLMMNNSEGRIATLEEEKNNLITKNNKLKNQLKTKRIGQVKLYSFSTIAIILIFLFALWTYNYADNSPIYQSEVSIQKEFTEEKTGN